MSDKAQKEYDLVEFIGHLSAINAEIHNRELAYFYADHGMNLDQSVALAKRELDVRQDIYTWDVLAWALYRRGDLQQASDAISHAIAQGTKDALVLFHAGMVHAGLGEQEKAQRCLENALAINPYFHLVHAEEARRTLDEMRTIATHTNAVERIDAHR